jgi:N-acetylglucosaminyldiphosphoundecaprenol N-acetyl-beta-D-mannosaminyltransferase
MTMSTEAASLGTGSMVGLSPLERLRVAGCPVTRISFPQAAEELCRRIDQGVSTHVVFVNASKVVKYRDDSRLRGAMESADLLLADGVPVVWASRLLGLPLPGRVNGTDLMEHMVEIAAQRGYRVFFLGARREVLDRAIAKLQVRYPSLMVAGRRDGYFRPDEESQVIEEIVQSQSQLVFLAISTPQKEIWGYENLHRLGPVVVQGVGGSVDVVAGLVQRAPRWMQRCGLEWFFRFLQEPGRMWRRYLETNSRFVWLVLADIMRRRLRRVYA